MMVQPAASAGPSFQAAISSGKFQGMICPTTPTGLAISSKRSGEVNSCTTAAFIVYLPPCSVLCIKMRNRRITCQKVFEKIHSLLISVAKAGERKVKRAVIEGNKMVTILDCPTSTVQSRQCVEGNPSSCDEAT
jgi:hypothetical protein